MAGHPLSSLSAYNNLQKLEHSEEYVMDHVWIINDICPECNSRISLDSYLSF